MVEGARKVVHRSLLYCHSLCSILGDVERGSVPSVGSHPEHRVTIDHEHQPKLGYSSSDHHYLFPSFDSYCAPYALILDRRETRVLFLSVYLAYKENSSKKNQKQ